MKAAPFVSEFDIYTDFGRNRSPPSNDFKRQRIFNISFELSILFAGEPGTVLITTLGVIPRLVLGWPRSESSPLASTRLFLLPVFTVYILESASSGRFYVGHTVDLEDRLLRHEQDRSVSTRGRGPWLLVYTECFATRSGAVCREHPERTGVRRGGEACSVRSVLTTHAHPGMQLAFSCPRQARP